MARTAETDKIERVIKFDVGGTSTDAGFYSGGFERLFETVVAGVRLRAPIMSINVRVGSIQSRYFPIVSSLTRIAA